MKSRAYGFFHNFSENLVAFAGHMVRVNRFVFLPHLESVHVPVTFDKIGVMSYASGNNRFVFIQTLQKVIHYQLIDKVCVIGIKVMLEEIYCRT